jgi:hypothetical protein
MMPSACTLLRHYASLRLPDGFGARVREVLAETLADEERSVRLVHAKEDNPLNLVEARAVR